jgi:MFS family permease
MLGPDVRIVLALMPSLALEVPVLALLGASAVTFAAGINSSLQLTARPEMRGRVMALYSVVFLGSTPIGAPLVGWLSETYDPRAALLLAASAGLLAGAGGYAALARSRSRLGSWNSTEKIASPTTLRASL